METRASYVLVGVFTLIALLAGLGFALWLARFELDRRYEYYDILFDNVSGLYRGGEVRFNGVIVGQVLSFQFEPEDPTLVRVRVEVAADTPIPTNVEAQLALQGVTGVAYVALTAPDSDAPLLDAISEDPIPTIRADPSPFDELLTDAPDLLRESLALIQEIRSFVGPDNQAAANEILANFASASARLEQALDDFSTISTEVAAATRVFGDFAEGLEPIAEGIGGTVAQAEAALAAAEAALSEAETTFAAANALVADRLPAILDTTEATVAGIGAAAEDLSTELAAAAGAATARFEQAEAAIARSEEALAQTTATLRAVESTAQTLDALIAGEGAALVADSRTAVAAATEALESARRITTEDVPGIVDDVRAATATVNAVASRVGSDIAGLTGELDGLAAEAGTTLAAATETFRNANATLGAINGAITTAEGTLAAAGETFASANRVLQEDVGTVVAEIQGISQSLDAALGDLSRDLPGITADLQSAISNADAAFTTLNAAVSEAAPPVQDFARSGLPQLNRLLQEARTLVGNLERLTQRIERDPTRFFLGR